MWRMAFGSASEKGLLLFFCAWADGSPMHFFVVFDGHGGLKVSVLCREQMHAIMVEELAGRGNDEESECRAWEAVLNRSFELAYALGMGLTKRRTHCRGGASGPWQHPGGQLRRLPCR